MKRFSIVLGLCALLMSCSNDDTTTTSRYTYQEETDRIIITDVDSARREPHIGQCGYRLSIVPSGGGEWFYDTCGKYQTGDILNK